jgi:hypothetical protein
VATNYDSIDFSWSVRGDFLKDSTGDLASTDEDAIESEEAEILNLLMSLSGDYELHYTFAGDLKEFIGKPNTRETGKEISDKIRTSLVLANIVAANDIKVRVVPIRFDAIMIIIQINAAATQYNSLEAGQPLEIKFTFNLVSGGIVYVEKDKSTNLVPVMR